MEQLVRVQKCCENGVAQVLHIRQSACSGDCHKCSGCGAVQETVLLTVANPIHARPGDIVRIQASSGPVLGAAALLYVLPLVLFFAGYALGHSLYQQGALTGGLLFAGGIALAVGYDRLIAKKRKTQYTITGFVSKNAQ